MKYVYAILAIIGIVVGIGFFAAAKSAVHEIEALIIFLSSAVMMVAAEVCEVSAELRKTRKDEMKTDTAKREPVITSEMIEKFSNKTKPA